MSDPSTWKETANTVLIGASKAPRRGEDYWRGIAMLAEMMDLDAREIADRAEAMDDDAPERKRTDRLPKPIISVSGKVRQTPAHYLLTRLYRFEYDGETHVLTSDRATVQFIRKLQADFLAANPGKTIPTIQVEILDIMKLTKLNVVKVFKAGLQSIILDTEFRDVEPFTQLKRYRRYAVDFVRKPRKPKKRKGKAEDR